MSSTVSRVPFIPVTGRADTYITAVPSCKSGPGQSCPLDTYATLIANKTAAAGTYAEICQLNITKPTQAELKMKATFLQDDALSWGYFVAP